MEYTVRLMEDESFSLVNKNVPGKSEKSKEFKRKATQATGKRKVEMQTLRISEETEQLLYDTLKDIYGSSFKLCDASEFENKKLDLRKQYWMDQGNLIVKGIVDYSNKDTTPKTQEEITRQFAVSKLETYSFHSSHCLEALMYTKGNMGKALEILFSKYYGVQNPSSITLPGDINFESIFERRQEEREALESIYEKETVVQSVKKSEKEVCRLFIHKKCRFGNKCRFLHQQPQQVQKLPVKEDQYFTLEVRFPEDCKYPHEPPYFYFYKNDGLYPKINCLRIARRLYDEALSFTMDGMPCIYSVISLLENEHEIKEYLEQNREQFLNQYDSLFPKQLQLNQQGAVPSHNKLGTINKRNRNDISLQEIIKQDDLIETKFKEKQRHPNYIKMKETRRKLPAWSQMQKILEVIHENQIVLISGETGCGKSTQVPQFLLDDWIINRSEKKEHINIICTQPRRISAIGVAERVAAERDERVGNTVGYQIRLETKISDKTRLTFCTTGILLQMISVNPELPNVTHIIVDEIHERSAESDFLLMLLKELLCKRPNLKIILMSATLKADIFSSYFGGAPVLHIPGKNFPVEQLFLEDIFEMTNHVLEENSKFTRKIKGGWEQLEIDLQTSDIKETALFLPKDTITDEHLTLTQIVNRYHGYSRQTQKNLYVTDYEKINFELIENVLEWIVLGEHKYPKVGSILVFLPGLAEIITLRDHLNDNKNLSPKSNKFIIIPLHSSLSNEEQSLIFKKTEGGLRKIVLSTNIAETSITVDDCVFVVDTGKVKEIRFNSNQNLESLEMCWVSRANVLQRKGRAGRVMPGVCIHLYTSYRFKYHFSGQPIAEILRIPLEPLLLRIRLIRKEEKVDLFNVLGKLLEAPTRESIRDSIKRLQDVGAFDSENMLTPLGHHLATLPVNVKIGKLILFGTIFCCIDSALTIAACLSHKNPFSVPYEKRHETDPKKEFSTACSDQLSILKAYKKWIEACSKSTYAGQVFANENFLSVRTLHALADIKYQLLELLVSIGFVSANLPKRQARVDRIIEITGNELNVNNENYKLLQGLLCAALYPNVVKIFTPGKSFQIQAVGAVAMQPKSEELQFQTKDDGFVSIHPSSVNFRTGYFSSPYLVFQEKIKTSRVFIKEVSMVPTLSLLLFSSYELNIELYNGMFVISLEDGWILFGIESHRVGQLLQRIRLELIKLLEQKMEDPLLNLVNHQHGKRIIQTIVSVVTKE
ncbi:hypothetical protein KM043_017775 [Ampulex compressa]|nr:hypothetical protein KM043_017775 [Ampulex compressa]